MRASFRLAMVAGSTLAAEEALLAIKQVFGEAVNATPFAFSGKYAEQDADLFICPTALLADLAKKIPANKLIGIDMILSPKCCVKLATLNPDLKRWIFSSNRQSAAALLEHCRVSGIPTELFDLATFDDTPKQTLAKIFSQARYVIGAAAFTAQGGLLHKHFGQHLRPDCEAIVIERILEPHSVAAITKWLIEHLRFQRHDHTFCPMRMSYERLLSEFAARKHIQERLEYENNHDELTGLYNRRFLGAAIAKLHKTDCLPLAAISIDLDRLKYINDNYGHHEGDAAIIEAASIIKRCTGPNSIVARVGGDEFVALLPNTSEPELQQVVAMMFEEVRQTNSRSRCFPIQLSIGYAISDSYVPPQQLLKTADEAMYKDKGYSGSRRLGAGTN